MPSKMLRKNIVLFPGSDSAPLDVPHRVLQIIGDEVVLFRLVMPLRKPFFQDKTVVTSWLNTGEMKIGDFPLPIYIQPDAQIPASYQSKRDAHWLNIKPLVVGENELVIFSIGDRWRLVSRRAKEIGLTPAYLLRLLLRYWLYGQIPNALTPALGNSGGKGASKNSTGEKLGRRRKVYLSGHDPEALGVNVSPQDKIYIAISVKQYHLRQGKTLADSRQDMIDRYYSKLQLVDGELIKLPLPDSQLIQPPAYRYWANKLLSDTSLQLEVLEDSFWRKRLRGRSGKAWQTTIGSADIYEIDATVGNFFLISEFSPTRLIGRPVIYFVIDRRSSMIVGLHVGLEGPSWNAARYALFSAFTSKVEFCRKYDIHIKEEDWPAQEMCNMIVADNAELLGKNAERSLQDFLNLDCQFNPPGIPVGKGTIESKFFTVLEKVSWVPGAWKARAAEHDRRNDLDMRWDARLTLRDLTRILIDEVIAHNNANRVEGIRTKEMIQANVQPYRRDIYLWSLENESGERVRHPDKDALYRCLLPSKLFSMTEAGLAANGAYYLPIEGDIETLLAAHRRKRRKLRVHYDTNSDDQVFVIDDKTGKWSTWQLSPASSEIYAKMRLEELLELQAADEFAAHDAVDHENRERAKKKQRQSVIVAKAKQKRAATKPVINKREYLESKGQNRALEVFVQRAVEKVAAQKSSAIEPELRPKTAPSVVSRRNNVIALLRQRNKRDIGNS